jgi:ABC-type Zn2+ transport system substrate-binding protein/surface adhesin
MRLNKHIWLNGAAILAMLGFLAGCEGTTPTPTKTDTKKPDAHADHDHDHAKEEKGAAEHKHGPNDGHVVELEGEGEHYHLEWADDDATGTVTMYILDKDEKNIPDLDASEITVESKAGDKMTEYKLPKVATESATVKASKFEVVEKPLLNALMAPEGVTNTVKVTIGGKPYTGVIKYDPANAH